MRCNTHRLQQVAAEHRRLYSKPETTTTTTVPAAVVVVPNPGDNVAALNSSSADNKKKKKLKKTKETHEDSNQLTDNVDGLNSSSSDKKKKKKMKRADKKNKTDRKETRTITTDDDEDDDSNQLTDDMDVAKPVKKVKKVSSNKKRKIAKLPEAEMIEAVGSTIPDEVHESKSSDGKKDKKTSKSKKKKRDKESRKKDTVRENVSQSDDADQQQSGNLKSPSQIDNTATLFDDEDEVYEMSSGDEDETTGMKRWITKYHRARPGAEVLMENINDFLVDYAAQKEQEKNEKEEIAADGGWTVVTHKKGRKKTKEVESGTTVGSVAQAVVMEKLSKMKDKQVGLNFYRFQKREAQRNEIMTLQSKFEQDKKRIQELRVARKFRPY